MFIVVIGVMRVILFIFFLFRYFFLILMMFFFLSFLLGMFDVIRSVFLFGFVSLRILMILSYLFVGMWFIMVFLGIIFILRFFGIFYIFRILSVSLSRVILMGMFENICLK